MLRGTVNDRAPCWDLGAVYTSLEPECECEASSSSPGRLVRTRRAFAWRERGARALPMHRLVFELGAVLRERRRWALGAATGEGYTMAQGGPRRAGTDGGVGWVWSPAWLEL